MQQREQYDEDGAINLVAAVYREACRELISAYRRGDHFKITTQERWIRENNYGLIKDPEGIIDACRKIASSRGKLKRKYKKRRANESVLHGE